MRGASLSFVAFLLVVGWVANIFQIMSSIPATFGEIAPIFLVKCAGAFFFPIGVILGWVGFF